MKVNDIITESASAEQLTEEFDLIESIINRLAEHNGVDAEVIWEDLETLSEDELYVFAVTSEPIMESQGVAEATGDEKFDTMMSRMTAEPKYPDKQMIPTSIPELIRWADQNNKPYHKFFALWAREHRFTNVNDALVWVGDNVDPYDEFGPKNFRDAWDEYDVGEPLIDAAKHDPDAAELLKVYKCYEEIVDDWGDDYRQMNMKEGVAEGAALKQAKRKYNQAAKDANTDQVGAGKKIDTMKKSLRQKDLGKEQGMTESEAWQKANNRDKTDGMSRKAVKTYRREHPGSKLQTAVTTKPSKLKKGSKASKRRKSYCSRSRGQMKMHNISCAKTPDKAICKARRRWNC